MTKPSMQMKKKLRLFAAAGLCLSAGIQAWAQDSGTTDSKLKITGFVSLVGGKVLNGGFGENYAANDGPATVDGHACPCYAADWSNAGVYNNSFSLTPESRAGVQVNYALTDQANLVGQVVARSATSAAELTWAYGSYKLTKNWEIQVGRKRIPLYYYSDFQDIGVAYPWVSPPPELYGWDATNYNGGSLRYSNSYGNTNVTSNVFTGREDIKKSYYSNLFPHDGDVKVTWKNIRGGDLEVNNGPLTVRGVYIKADTINDGTPSALTAYGVAANLDYDSWFVLSEFTKLTRDYSDYGFAAPTATLGVGWRLGKWTPFVNFAKYTESSTYGEYYPQSYKRTSFTMRYDLDSSSAIKGQIDRHLDVTQNFGGDVTVFRLSYDRVF
jgi:hypothetical protein